MRLTVLGSALAVAGAVHTAVNLRRLRTPPARPPAPTEPVSVLLPVRDEGPRVQACLHAVLAALDYPTPWAAAEVVVLDDGSTDATAALVLEVAAADPRVRLVRGAPLPAGWLGKPWACAQLAETADLGSSVLVFLDADVTVDPVGLAATVALLRDAGLDLVSPYPRQETGSAAERLVQPLLQWSWLTTLPLALAERSPRPSLAAANGQLLAVDAAAYRRAGGHAASPSAVLEDLALVRAVKAAGGRGGVADGTRVASCRMYEDWPTLRAGYTKSLWSAFGSPVGAGVVMAGLVLTYVLPPAAALRGSRVGAVGYAAAVAGRVLVARRTASRAFPDPLAHPVSVLALVALTAESFRGRREGTLAWKGRPVR